jgi:hypothetical protein
VDHRFGRIRGEFGGPVHVALAKIAECLCAGRREPAASRPLQLRSVEAAESPAHRGQREYCSRIFGWLEAGAHDQVDAIVCNVRPGCQRDHAHWPKFGFQRAEHLSYLPCMNRIRNGVIIGCDDDVHRIRRPELGYRRGQDTGRALAVIDWYLDLNRKATNSRRVLHRRISAF